MHRQNSLLYQPTYRHAIEAVPKLPPQRYRVPALALIIEPIRLVYRLTLMVASQKIESFGVLYFVSQ